MTRTPSDFGAVVRTDGVCSGAERFAGTRIPVATVLRLLGEWDDARILAGYPALHAEDIVTARRIAGQGAVLCTGECGRMWRGVPAESPRPFVCLDCRAGWPLDGADQDLLDDIKAGRV